METHRINFINRLTDQLPTDTWLYSVQQETLISIQTISEPEEEDGTELHQRDGTVEFNSWDKQNAQTAELAGFVESYLAEPVYEFDERVFETPEALLMEFAGHEIGNYTSRLSKDRTYEQMGVTFRELRQAQAVISDNSNIS